MKLDDIYWHRHTKFAIASISVIGVISFYLSYHIIEKLCFERGEFDVTWQIAILVFCLPFGIAFCFFKIFEIIGKLINFPRKNNQTD